VKALVSGAEAAAIARQAQRGHALAYRVVQAHWAYQCYRTVQLKRLLGAAVGAWKMCNGAMPNARCYESSPRIRRDVRGRKKGWEFTDELRTTNGVRYVGRPYYENGVEAGMEWRLDEESVR
jgi:hypothetical protein